MKRKHLPLFMVLAIIIGAGIAFSLFSLFSIEKPLETRIIPAAFTLTDQNTVGIDVNTTLLTFGRVPFGGLSKRYVEVKNDYPHPITVRISATGNITSYLFLEKNDIVFQPGEVKNITIAINPNNGTYAAYDGEVAFTFWKPS